MFAPKESRSAARPRRGLSPSGRLGAGHGLPPVPLDGLIGDAGRGRASPPPQVGKTKDPCGERAGRFVRLKAIRLSFPLSTRVYQSRAEGRCCHLSTSGVGVAPTYTQLSRFYLATHPLYRLMVQFRANESHPGRPADSLRSPVCGSARSRRLTPVVSLPCVPSVVLDWAHATALPLNGAKQPEN